MNVPPMDYLASRAFPELAAIIRHAISPTIAQWEQSVRAALPAANGLSNSQLRDDLPKVLAFAADAIEAEAWGPTTALADMAPLHGAVRYDQGFQLDELFIEYTLLRGTLITEVASQLKRPLEPAEYLAIIAALDVSLRKSVGRFVDHLSQKLQNASESHSKYLSFLSHDLRGGLNGVFLMIEVIKRELVHEPRLAETVDDLDAMRRSLLDTVATMDRFLHAERFRKGNVVVRPAKVSLRALLSEAVAHYSYQAREKGVRMDVDVPAEAEIISDRELLNLIIQNLLSNALKYTNSNTTVNVNAAPTDPHWTIAIADGGPGIEQAKLEELFIPFTRGETYGQPGVGLGLSIARQAAQYLNARLWAESTPGHGATFFVELPREYRKPG